MEEKEILFAGGDQEARDIFLKEKHGLEYGLVCFCTEKLVYKAELSHFLSKTILEVMFFTSDCRTRDDAFALWKRLGGLHRQKEAGKK